MIVQALNHSLNRQLDENYTRQKYIMAPIFNTMCEWQSTRSEVNSLELVYIMVRVSIGARVRVKVRAMVSLALGTSWLGEKLTATCPELSGPSCLCCTIPQFIRPIISPLHPLPVRHRITHKVATLTLHITDRV